jgi:hypothetical protein
LTEWSRRVRRNGKPKDVARELRRWEEETLAKTLDAGGERDADFSTSVEPAGRLYTPLDIADLD